MNCITLWESAGESHASIAEKRCNMSEVGISGQMDIEQDTHPICPLIIEFSLHIPGSQLTNVPQSISLSNPDSSSAASQQVQSKWITKEASKEKESQKHQ